MLTSRRTLIVACMVVAELAFATNAQAGLFTWLFGRRRTAYYPVGTISYYQPGGNVAYYQPAGNVAYYQPAGNEAYYQPAGNVAYYQPAGSVAYYQPQTTVNFAQPVGTTAYYGESACQPIQQQVVVNYVPQTYYRSRLMRVPVTTYRPEFSVDPVTGATVTVMRPCTYYNWQVARVPYTTFLPTFGAVAPAAVAQTSTIGCAPATTAAPTATPYYSPTPGATSVPFGAPSTTVPFGQPSTTMPLSPTPADQAPSLNPGALQPGFQGSGTRLYPPANGNSGSTYSNSSSGTQQKPASGSNLQPVPDPDAERSQLRPNAAPRLLNPRDQTAALTVERAWAATPISWPTSQSVRQTSATSAPSAASSANKWDDSGWRSFAP